MAPVVPTLSASSCAAPRVASRGRRAPERARGMARAAMAESTRSRRARSFAAAAAFRVAALGVDGRVKKRYCMFPAVRLDAKIRCGSANTLWFQRKPPTSLHALECPQQNGLNTRSSRFRAQAQAYPLRRGVPRSPPSRSPGPHSPTFHPAGLRRLLVAYRTLARLFS